MSKRSTAAAAVARRRARLRARWRVATSALRTIGPGTLLGSSSTAPGGSIPAPGGGTSGAPAPGGGSGPGPPPVYHTLSVASREFSLILSRPLLTAGTETIQLNNRGEDPHNLVIERDDGSGGGPLATYPDVESLESHTEQVELPAGRYKLWCSLPGHEAKGMRATLQVE